MDYRALLCFLCVLQLTLGDMCVCPLEYSPVCGSDGNTYKNERCMKCRNPELEFVKYGECFVENVVSN